MSNPTSAALQPWAPALMQRLNGWILTHIRSLEMLGVLMRITSFSVVSWMGPSSPFMLVWVFNTLDALLLSWCSLLKRDRAYTLLNCFWVVVGVVGILRAQQIIH